MINSFTRTVMSIIFAATLMNSVATAQSCYVIADRPDPDNVYFYDLTLPPSDPSWETALPGDTGVNSIEASEYDPVSGTLYAWNADDFGYIDLATGAFVSAGTSPGFVCGYQGGTYVCFDGTNGAALGMNSGNYDVDGMAYNPISDAWYASVRILDGNATTAGADWLVQYDSNGVFIPDAFGYDANGNPIGFVEIGYFTGSDGNELHDIDDLAFNPFTGQLYGVANRSGGSVTHMVEIDPATGNVVDLGPIQTTTDCDGDGTTPDNLSDVEGLSIDLQGRIWAVTGASGLACARSLYEWNGALDGTPIVATFEATMSEDDQESISCSVYEPVSVGDTIWFDTNGDGDQDAGEAGIPGVVLYITNANGDTLGTATTDANGNYLFDGLPPDANGYTVIVGSENFAPGGVLEGLNSTNDPDSGPGAGDNEATSSSLPNGGDSDMNLDFGFVDEPLPVELTAFSIDVVGSKASLSWTTSSEMNNSGFAIELAPLGGDFEQIGWVTGNGTTDIESNYDFTFEANFFKSRRVRLKQVDFDGGIDYSNELLVDSDIPSSFILGEPYPNPFNPEAKIQLSVRENEEITVSLFDATGRMVGTLLQGEVSANQALTLTIDGSDLTSGVYLVRAVGESFAATRVLTLSK